MKIAKGYARFFSVLLLPAALIAMFFLAAAAPGRADDRKEPIDVILMLDKSLSMDEQNKIQAVREYVNSSIIDQMLIQGDLFILINFYGKTDAPIVRKIESDADRQAIKEVVSGIRADGRYTDIGNALDTLRRTIEELPGGSRRKYILLLTDGRQEAPPGSKYYSKDGSFNHEMLANTKVIQKQGWKIHVLGIGTEQEAQKLAVELSATFGNITEPLTGDILAEQTRGLLGRVDLHGAPTLADVPRDGRSKLTLNLVSQGYPQEVPIGIRSIRVSLPDRSWENILDGGSYAFTMPPEGSRRVEIPVRLAGRLPGGDYRGSLQFTFLEGESFLPSVTEVRFRVQSTLERALGGWNLAWAVAVLLGLLILVVVLVIHRGRFAPVHFQVQVEGRPGEPALGTFALREGKGLFLNESGGSISLAEARDPKSVAHLFVTGGTLCMNVLRRERFPRLKDMPRDIREATFRIRAESGGDLSVKFMRMEKNG